MLKKSIFGLIAGSMFMAVDAFAIQDASIWITSDIINQENPVVNQEGPNNKPNSQYNPSSTTQTEENTEKVVVFDFIEENRNVRNERDEILITPNQKLLIISSPFSNNPPKVQPKTEDPNQPSILSFNLFLNLLYKFKTSEN
jgi:hypothetical protein